MASVALKKNFRCFQSLNQFYSGGPFIVSSDGSFIVCACDDKIKIVDSSNSSIKSIIEGDSEAVTALALSPNDTLLFSASHSRQIRVWDLSTLKCLRSWKGHDGPVMAMTCDASGGLLATGGADRKVLVWDVDGGFCTHFFKGHKGVVSSVMFHPDHNKLMLFSGSDDSTIRVWDLTKKKCISTLEKHFSTVTSLQISEDGWTLLSSGRDKVVNVWDLHDYSCKITVPTYEALEAVCLVSSSSPFVSWIHSKKSKTVKKKTNTSDVYFFTVGERGIVRLWNSEGSVCLFEQKTSDITAISQDDEDAKRGFTAAVLLPQGQGLLCVTADQQFLFYSLTENDNAFSDLTLTKRLIGFNEEIVDMKFLGESEKFIAVATSVEQVRVYELASMSCSYVLSGHKDIVLCLDTCVTSSGETLIVTGSKDNTVRLWEANTGNCIGVGAGHMGAVGAVAFSKKHRNFFISGSSDRTLKVWNLDGTSDDDVNNLKAKAVVAAHDKDINSVAVAPNDSLACSGSQDRTACVWRLPDLVLAVTLKGHKRGIWSVEFSPVDQCVITASGDKTIKIWAISDGSCLKTFEGHTSSVYRASFITRGTQFVSCGADGLLKLWTVKTNECIATFDQHEDKVWALAVGKETEMIATGGSDAVVNLWNDSTAFDKEEAFREEEEEILKGQELENAVTDANFTKAIQIAFELRRPRRLFELFSELCRKREVDGRLDKALRSLDKENFHLLFEYAREWNTKPRFCHIAHFVLYKAFSILPPTEIIEIKGIGEILEGLIPYSQRHFSRIDRLQRSTFLLDYTLMGMSVIEPDSTAIQSDEEKEEASEEPKVDRISSKKRKSKKTGRDVPAYKKIRKESKSKVVGVTEVSA
ncbi:transducin beta-like protein 3 [Impatiens glandulifera]|uniref:transducin beta-like protein 3 n=1 Tax=Impatiens glandulifera TaxID=253017 RepID=UPI001FB17D18|nr:transducin beta-like protein 3 [Impatiens glandulifera]